MRNFLLAAIAALALYGPGVGDAVGQNSLDLNNRWVTVTNNSKFDARKVTGAVNALEPATITLDLPPLPLLDHKCSVIDELPSGP